MAYHWVRTIQAVYLIMESIGFDRCTMASKVKVFSLKQTKKGRRKIKFKDPNAKGQEGKSSKTQMRKGRRAKDQKTQMQKAGGQEGCEPMLT
jgi:hypothetical protein